MRFAGNRILSMPSRALRSSHGLELAPLIALVIIGSIKSFYVCSTVDGLRSYSLAATSSIAGVTLPLFFLPFIPRLARFALLLLFNLALSLTLTMDLIHLQIAADVVSTASFQKIPLLPKVLWDSRSQLDPLFLLFFVDCFLWAICARSYIIACRIIPPAPRRLATRASLSLIVLGALAAFPSLQPIIRGGENVFAHTNVGRAVAAGIGLLPYHVVDLLGYRRTTGLEYTASDIEEVRSVVTGGTMSPRSELFGVARGSNLILINAESLQSFPIGLRINGRELTPRFSAFAAESLNFVAFYDQTHLGITSDGEFTALNSLHPKAWGTVAGNRRDNFFRALPTILSGHGYATMSACGADETFWNMNWLHPAYGFEHAFYADRFTMTETIYNWLADRSFFQQMVPRLTAHGEPFMAFLLPTSNHWPFKLPKVYGRFDLGHLEGTWVSDYLQSVHYFDSAFGHLVDLLKAEGLLQRSVIALYGDHRAFLSPRGQVGLPAELAPEGEYDRFVLIKRLPFMIRLPGAEAAGKRFEVGGHLDITPTLLSLLGIEGENEVMLGRDLTGRGEGLTVFRDGSFITDRCYCVNHLGPISNCRCYDPSTGERIGCAPFRGLRADARRALRVSDFIVEGNLLPLVRPPNIRYSLEPLRAGSKEEERIVSTDGRIVPVAQGAVQGFVDAVHAGTEVMSVVGWAVDADLRSSVDEIVVFVSGEAVHHRQRPLPRDDVRKIYPLVKNSGFRVIVPIAEDGLEGDTDIRVFGISRGGVAGELNYTPTFNSLRESLALRHINATTTGLL